MDRTPSQPRLSAILNMLADFQWIRKTVRHICAQTVAGQIELVIVTTPERASQVEPEELSAVGTWQVVTMAEIPSGAAAWAAGIAKARAPIVVLAEDHSYPEPQWAEALMEAHREDYAAVTPVVRIGNPGSRVSCANFLLCFVEWFGADGNREVDSGAGHNTSYKRDVLAGYPDLGKWLLSERLLHFDLAAKGFRILMAAGAATHHMNISLPGALLSHSFHGGRLFGASRAADWTAVRAWAYALSFPLVPAIRLLRIWKRVDTAEKRRLSRFWAALPWTIAALLSHAFGEAAGYVSGEGNSIGRYMDFEACRRKYVCDRNVPLLGAPANRGAAAAISAG